MMEKEIKLYEKMGYTYCGFENNYHWFWFWTQSFSVHSFGYKCVYNNEFFYNFVPEDSLENFPPTAFATAAAARLSK